MDRDSKRTAENINEVPKPKDDKSGKETIGLAILLFILLCVVGFWAYRQSTNVTIDDDDLVYKKVDHMPEYPGGVDALVKYLSENVRYPQAAQEQNIEGRVICQFVVNKEGYIEDVEVIQSSGDASLDKEAVRVIESIPQWQPGSSNGRRKKVLYTLPINFKLE